jgi:hypothetical protein
MRPDGKEGSSQAWLETLALLTVPGLAAPTPLMPRTFLRPSQVFDGVDLVPSAGQEVRVESRRILAMGADLTVLPDNKIIELPRDTLALGFIAGHAREGQLARFLVQELSVSDWPISGCARCTTCPMASA